MIRTKRKSPKTSLANEVALTEAELEPVVGGNLIVYNIDPKFFAEGFTGVEGSTQIAATLMPGWTSACHRSDGTVGYMTEEEYGFARDNANIGSLHIPLFQPVAPGTGVPQFSSGASAVYFSQADINTAHQAILALEKGTTPSASPTTPSAPFHWSQVR